VSLPLWGTRRLNEPGIGEVQHIEALAHLVAERRVTGCSEGEGALKMLSEGIRPELIVILSDINMPGMDGLTL